MSCLFFVYKDRKPTQSCLYQIVCRECDSRHNRYRKLELLYPVILLTFCQLQGSSSRNLPPVSRTVESRLKSYLRRRRPYSDLPLHSLYLHTRIFCSMSSSGLPAVTLHFIDVNNLRVFCTDMSCHSAAEKRYAWIPLEVRINVPVASVSCCSICFRHSDNPEITRGRRYRYRAYLLLADAKMLSLWRYWGA